MRLLHPSKPLSEWYHSQQRFASIAARYDRLRAQQREALRQAEHLFQTLLHRAFRGEPGESDGAAMDAALAEAPARNGHGVANGELVDELIQIGLGLE